MHALCLFALAPPGFRYHELRDRVAQLHGPDPKTWAAEMAPGFAIEGHTLGVYLEYAAAEQGWTLHYADPAVAESAKRITLHGSVEGLTAEDALGVVLATSSLQYNLRSGELYVSKSGAR